MHLNSSYNMDGCYGGRNEQIEQNFHLKLTFFAIFHILDKYNRFHLNAVLQINFSNSLFLHKFFK